MTKPNLIVIDDEIARVKALSEATGISMAPKDVERILRDENALGVKLGTHAVARPHTNEGRVVPIIVPKGMERRGGEII